MACASVTTPPYLNAIFRHPFKYNFSQLPRSPKSNSPMNIMQGGYSNNAPQLFGQMRCLIANH
jgi:hypothetical protein